MESVFFDGGESEFRRRRVLSGLERARTRMAVAMARESKCTNASVRARYLDTENSLRNFLRPLRLGMFDTVFSSECWERAIEMLSNLPAPPEPGTSVSEIQVLCNCLCEILEILEPISQAGRKNRARFSVDESVS